MERVARGVALLVLLGCPYLFLYWLLLHPLARFWRSLPSTLTFLVINGAVVSAAVPIYLQRDALLRTHYGVRWPLIIVGLPFAVASMLLDRSRARSLDTRTLMGVPEMAQGGGSLVTDGVYERIRHPRYVSGFLGLAAASLFTNYLAVYVVWAAYVPAFLLFVTLEERELLHRFGASYDAYSRQVPRFVPRRRAQGKLD
jgi:protein-S-isoprenylcysteine O-methyltransferase Ste14